MRSSVVWAARVRCLASAAYWYQSAKPAEITAMFDRLTPMIAAGTISTPVAATYGFDQVNEAITKAAQSSGKVLFTAKT